jgi:polysaccharide export outer membrane protein
MGLALALWTGLSSSAVAQNAYQLRSGDTVRIEVLEDPSLNQILLVAPDGRISVPLAGNVRASGRTLEQIQQDLTSALSSNFASPPTVFVALQAERPIRPDLPPRTIDVFVVGEAANPGRLAVTSDTIVLQLFAEMGGFTRFAATKRLQLRRGEQIFTMNYKDIEMGTSNAGMMQLRDGDVLVIPQRRLFE